MRIEKIIATVLHEAHERQVGEALDAMEGNPIAYSFNRVSVEYDGRDLP